MDTREETTTHGSISNRHGWWTNAHRRLTNTNLRLHQLLRLLRLPSCLCPMRCDPHSHWRPWSPRGAVRPPPGSSRHLPRLLHFRSVVGRCYYYYYYCYYYWSLLLRTMWSLRKDWHRSLRSRQWLGDWMNALILGLEDLNARPPKNKQL